jgi:hypothetical protein
MQIGVRVRWLPRANAVQRSDWARRERASARARPRRSAPGVSGRELPATTRTARCRIVDRARLRNAGADWRRGTKDGAFDSREPLGGQVARTRRPDFPAHQRPNYTAPRPDRRIDAFRALSWSSATGPDARR